MLHTNNTYISGMKKLTVKDTIGKGRGRVSPLFQKTVFPFAMGKLSLSEPQASTGFDTVQRFGLVSQKVEFSCKRFCLVFKVFFDSFYKRSLCFVLKRFSKNDM